MSCWWLVLQFHNSLCRLTFLQSRPCFLGRLCSFEKDLENQLLQLLFINWIMKGHGTNNLHICADRLWRAHAFLQSCLSPVLRWGSSCTESHGQSSAHCLLSVQYYDCLGQGRWYFPYKGIVSFDHIRNSLVFAVLRNRVSGLATLDFLWAVGPGETHTRALGSQTWPLIITLMSVAYYKIVNCQEHLCFSRFLKWNTSAWITSQCHRHNADGLCEMSC